MHTYGEMPAVPAEPRGNEEQRQREKTEASVRELRPKAITQSQLVDLWIREHAPGSSEERLRMELAWAQTYAARFSEMYDAKPKEGEANTFRQLVEGCDGGEACLRQIQEILNRSLTEH